MRSSRTVAALLVATALALLPLAGEAAAAPAKDGTIAFAGKRAGVLVVFTRKPNTRQLRAPLGIQGGDQPAFSPRGRRLAFRRFGAAGPEIWISYPGGIGLRRLTPGRRDGEPAWSPTGDALTFARGRRGHRDVYRIGADGTLLKRLTKSARDDSSPAWSRRNAIAFVRRNPRHNDDIYAMPATGGAAHRLTRSHRPDAYPAWSPTGRTLVFARGRFGHRDLFVTTSAGKHGRALTHLPGDESEPVFSPNGRWIAFSYRRHGKRWIYFFRPRRKPLSNLDAHFHRLTSARSASRSPSWQRAGLDPQIAAAGDIACNPNSPNFRGGFGTARNCRALYTSNLMLGMDLSRVLAIGDEQYQEGTLDNFRRSYDLSWGRLKDMTSPVPGNHEYLQDPTAAGYYDYFNGPGVLNGPAGNRTAGYYSYDVGRWHIMAINSECTNIGGCGPDSPELRWIRADLAAHPAFCTLAYFHRPLFTSAGFESQSSVRPIWDALYPAGVDLILNGHDHIYERFAPQRPDGAYDPVQGIREITVGTGGVFHHSTVTDAPNSQVADQDTYGVLKLTLRRGRYDWRYVTIPRGGTGDSGSTRCH